MNSLFLVIVTLVAFAFGYRFYAKWLSLDVFQLQNKYSTPAHTRFDDRDHVPAQRHLLFGHHLAAVAAGAVFLGPVVAAAWGWIPAFLWIVAGSAVAAGVYALGSYWLVVRQPLTLWEIARSLIGSWGGPALIVLAVPVLLILAAAGAGFVASLLAAYPTAALPLAGLALVAAALGTFLHGRPEITLAPASIAALLLVVMLLWLFDATSLAFTGALQLDLAGETLFSVDAVSVWLVVVLGYAFFSARAPVWRLIRPRGYLTALLTGFALLGFYAGIAVEQPALVAPPFHEAPDRPGALPWLFLVVSSGALAGFQFLVIHGVTARQLRRVGDARFVGYGGALAEGLLALTALLVATTSFAEADTWSSYFRSVSAANVSGVFKLYVDGYVRIAAGIGLDPDFARTLVVTVAAGLALSTVEAAIRALHRLIPDTTEAGDAKGASHRLGTRSLWAVIAAVAVLALADGHGLGGVEAWPLFAPLNLWLAALVLWLVAMALRAGELPFAPVLALAGAASLIGLWASAAQLIAWWSAGETLFFVAGLLATLVSAGAIGRSALALAADYGLRLPGT